MIHVTQYNKLTCDDDNECTTDSCNPDTGCPEETISCNDYDAVPMMVVILALAASTLMSFVTITMLVLMTHVTPS